MKAALKLWRPALFAFLAMLAGSLAAAPYNPPVLKPATNGSRFLFVYDISSAMKASDAANRQVLFDLIFTGFDGQMRHGDSFGLWLFNEEVKAGEFPLQVWDAEYPVEVASRAAQFIRSQKYGGKAHLEDVIPRIMQLSRTVRDVSLVLISTGEQPMHGTPFDASINEAYGRKQADRKKEPKPLITTINVRGGKVVSASVTLPGQFIQLPERPAPIVAAPAPDTNKTAQAAASAPPPRPIEEPRTIAALTVGSSPPTKVWTPSSTNEGPHSAPALSAAQTNASITSTSTPAPPVEPPSTAAAPTVPVAPVAPAPVVATAAAPTPPVPTPPITPAMAEPAPPEPVATSTLPTPIPEPIAVNARELPTPASPPLPGTVVILQPGLSPTLLLAIGATLLIACLTLLVMVLRRLRPPAQGSFITQSMGRR